MSHSIIPPSSAHIWGKPDGCTGWVLMNQCYPETESTIEAMEGEASHEIARILIEISARGSGLTFKDFEGKVHENGVMYTEEMFEGAKEYADDVAIVMRKSGVFAGPNLGIEKRLEMPQIHELEFGTCDCFLFNKKTNHLYIWDYKFGYLIYEAFENWQIIDYYAGIYNLLGFDGHQDQNITVHIRVAQPRAFHRGGTIREWTVKGSDLRGHINILHENAAKSLGPDAECKSGPHCRYCPARHACESALSAGMGLYEVASKPVPVELSAAALGTQLTIVKRARKQLEYLESGFEEQVKGLIKSGKNVPGWGTEQTYGREKWGKPFEEVIAMGDMLGNDLRRKEAITPNQARKLGIDDEMVKAYSTTPHAGLAIVPDNGNKVKQVFTQ